MRHKIDALPKTVNDEETKALSDTMADVKAQALVDALASTLAEEKPGREDERPSDKKKETL